jgi:signal transduction histidine kinase
MQDVVRLLRLAAIVFLVTLVPAGVALLSLSGLPDRWAWWGLVGLMLLPGVFVLIPGLERRLGDRYLPLALFLFITVQAIEFTVRADGPLQRRFLTQTGLDPELTLSAWRSEPFFFLLVPIVLAAWAYGRGGAIRAATWAILMHVAGGLWLWYHHGTFPQGYWRTMPLRLGILYAVPLIVAYLATRQRQQHEELETAHEQLQRQAALAEELAASRERNRLARDLHDTLAHSLAGLVVELEAVGTLFELDPEATRAELNKAQDLARAGLDEARKAIRDLRESPAQDLGLGPSLQRLVNDFGERTGLQAHAEFAVSGPELTLSPETSDALYRIVQEALANVERHADATSANLRLELADNTLALTISDDGSGFEPTSASDGSYGLLGMRERAEMIGAALQVESESGRGTRVSVRMNLADPGASV